MGSRKFQSTIQQINCNMICLVCLVQAQKKSNVTFKGSKTISINAKTVMDIKCVSVFTT